MLDPGFVPPRPSDRTVLKVAVRIIEQEQGKRWKDPTPEMLNDPLFDTIWNVIKSWDINVPEEYDGYCKATGNHVRAIYEAVSNELDSNGGEKERTKVQNHRGIRRALQRMVACISKQR